MTGPPRGAARQVRPARLPVRLPSQQPLELGRVEPRPADHSAIEQQHGNVQAMAPGKLGVRVHVDLLQGRQRHRSPERLELGQHLFAKAAVFAVEQREFWHVRRRPYRGGGPCSDIEGADWREPPSCGIDPGEDCSELAMALTVSGGTSPTAVILWPSTTVENAEVDPN